MVRTHRSGCAAWTANRGGLWQAGDEKTCTCGLTFPNHPVVPTQPAVFDDTVPALRAALERLMAAASNVSFPEKAQIHGNDSVFRALDHAADVLRETSLDARERMFRQGGMKL